MRSSHGHAPYSYAVISRISYPCSTFLNCIPSIRWCQEGLNVNGLALATAPSNTRYEETVNWSPSFLSILKSTPKKNWCTYARRVSWQNRVRQCVGRRCQQKLGSAGEVLLKIQNTQIHMCSSNMKMKMQNTQIHKRHSNKNVMM